LRKLLDSGYDLTSVKAFDLFPQTYHVETVARLQLT
jgi:tRNA/tmRNA/rRNA uracil-C5-methylase (TrmA/RlmC/RlmD family)